MSKPILTQKIIQKVISPYSIYNKSIQRKMEPLELNRFKRIFAQEAKQFYAERGKDFVIDSDNKNFLNLICKYFARDASFEKEHGGNLKKGLFIYGNPGSGKTTSLNVIQRISVLHGLRQLWFPIIDAQFVVNKFNSEKNKEHVVSNYSKGNFAFDDLGAENPANNIFVFGKEDIFIRILEARYNEFVNKGIVTHLTSNLSISAIEKRYGSRVEDRFYEMFNLLQLNKNGDSRR